MIFIVASFGQMRLIQQRGDRREARRRSWGEWPRTVGLCFHDRRLTQSLPRWRLARGHGDINGLAKCDVSQNADSGLRSGPQGHSSTRTPSAVRCAEAERVPVVPSKGCASYATTTCSSRAPCDGLDRTAGSVQSGSNSRISGSAPGRKRSNCGLSRRSSSSIPRSATTVGDDDIESLPLHGRAKLLARRHPATHIVDTGRADSAR